MAFLPYILLVMLPTLALTLWAAWRVRSTYSKWDKVDSGLSMSAFDFALPLLPLAGRRRTSLIGFARGRR